MSQNVHHGLFTTACIHINVFTLNAINVFTERHFITRLFWLAVLSLCVAYNKLLLPAIPLRQHLASDVMMQTGGNSMKTHSVQNNIHYKNYTLLKARKMNKQIQIDTITKGKVSNPSLKICRVDAEWIQSQRQDI